LELRVLLSASPAIRPDDANGNPPNVAISAANVTSTSQASEAITVTFTDSAGIDPSTINTGNITVTNVSTSAVLTVTGVTLNPSNGVAGQVTAVYTVAAPDAGGVFTTADDGNYSIVLGANQVADPFADQAAQTSGSFAVDIPPPGATVPTASVTPPGNVTAAGTSSVNVTVVYTATAGGNDAIDASTINNGNITVTGPSGALIVTGVSVSPSTGNAATLTATYSVQGPSGTFTPTSSGVYNIALNSGQPVLDTYALAAVASPASATFNVTLGGPTAAAINQPPAVTSAEPTETVTIVYSDAAGINLATIAPGNIVVTEQGVTNPTPLTVSGVTPSVTSGSPTQVTATYTIAAPAGGFSQASDGTYTVALQANQVEDINGLFAPAASSSFQVNIGAPATPPTAVIAPPDEVAGIGVSSVQVTVTYTDAVAINASTINAGNISVTGPSGAALTVTGVSVVPSSGNAASVSATYSVAAPSGVFGTGDNGTYTIALIANQVLDTNGLPATAAPATFNIDIPTPPPTVDPTFNGGSPVETPFAAEDAVSLPNGDLLVAGHQGDASNDGEQAVIERLLPDGSIDPTFGSGGKVITGSAGENDAAYSIGLNAAGQIVIAGTHAGEFAVWCFDANGKPDNSFGTGGLAATSLGSSDDIAYSFAIAPDGSIVLGGSSNGAFAFARFTANGTLDTTFGTGGRALFGVAGASDVVGAVAIEPDGNIIAAGSDGTKVDVLSLTPAGAEDQGFAGGNTLVLNELDVNTDLGTPDFTEGLAIQPNGQILVAKHTVGGHFGVVRINTDGSLDNSFGTGGLASADFGGDDDADTVQVQGTGQIFAIGTTDAGGSPQVAVAAFTTNGQLDPTFGVGGQFTAPVDVTASIVRAVPGELAPQALHIGDIFLRAFGDITATGQLVVGTTNESNPATQTPLLRLNVPGSGTVGTFGTIAGKNKNLVFLESNGTKVTLELKGGGSGTAYYNGTQIDLVLTGTGARSAVSVKAAGGNRRVALRNISSNGSLHAFSAPTGDLSGTLFIPGSIGAVTLGSITGAGTSTIAAAGSIGSIRIAGVATGATVLAGANLGSDDLVGGTGSAADTFAAGAIGKIAINGAVTNSTFGAGLDPADGVLRSVNDTVIGAAASRIGSISLKHPVDASTRFYAGAFGKIRAPKRVVPAAGTNFQVL